LRPDFSTTKHIKDITRCRKIQRSRIDSK